MKKILVPCDFSEVSYNASLYALHMAAALKKEVIFLHVFHIPVIDPNMPPEMVDDMIEEAQKSARKELEQFKERLQERIATLAVVVRFELKIGFVVEEIIQRAGELDLFMIIMGTHGASGLKRILGSNTALVSEKCKSPVLAVPEEAQYTGISHIVYATDLKSEDYQYIDQLLYISSRFSARITLLHVSKPGEEPDKVRIEDLKSYFWRELAMENIHFEIVTSDRVEEGIEGYLDAHEADILAMLKQRRNIIERIFNPSLTKRMTFHPKIPILTFHG